MSKNEPQWVDVPDDVISITVDDEGTHFEREGDYARDALEGLKIISDMDRHEGWNAAVNEAVRLHMIGAGDGEELRAENPY